MGVLARTWRSSLGAWSLALLLGCGGAAAAPSGDDGRRAIDSRRGEAPRPGGALDTASAETSARAQWEAASLFPFQEWPVVVGRRRGIVMAAGQQPWGGSVLWTRSVDTSDTRTEYRFYAEGSSAYAVYWHSPDGRGFNPMQSWTVLDPAGHEHTMPVAMFMPDTANGWGLRRRAHLVEVDALTPASRSSAIHFVIRDARVLDGSARYPLVVEDVLLDLRRRFDDTLAREEPAIQRILGEAREPVPADYERRAPDGPTVVLFPTWLDAEAVLEVVLLARYREAYQGPAQTRWSECPPCPCDPQGHCAPCMACEPHQETFRPQAHAGYEMAVRYRVDRRGALLQETLLSPKRY